MTGARMNDDELAAIQARADKRGHYPEYSSGSTTGRQSNHRQWCWCQRDTGEEWPCKPALLHDVRRLAAEVAVKDAALRRVKDAVDLWGADSHDAAACKKFTCVDCVVVNCDFDIRAALGGVGDHTTTDDPPPP